MLQISGINKFSVINYPGKVSCVLFAKGCPLHCSYCYNRILLKEPIIKEEWLKGFLEKRKGVLDGVVFSGGEPMMQYQGLLEAVNYVKDLGYKVGLHLTGLNVDKPEFKEIIDKSDWVGLDFKAPDYKYKKICGLDFKDFEQALHIILQSGITFEVRTTLDSRLTQEDLAWMASFLVKQGIKKWYLQRVMLTEGDFQFVPFPLKFEGVEVEVR